MKKLVAAIIALSGTTISFGQTWTQINGSTIYTPSTTVGIGTAVPNGYLSFPTHGSILTIGSTSNWANKNILSTSWSAANGDYTDLTVPGVGANSALLRLASTGNLGIGNPTPTEKLTVSGNVMLDGNLKFTSSSSTNTRQILGNSLNGGLALFSNGDASNGSFMAMYGNNATSAGQINFVAGDGNGSTTSANTAFNFLQYSAGAYPSYMSIFRDGKVVIGNISSRPGSYKLYVEQGILTEKIKVAVANDPTNWSDFVFADDYTLRPLNEVEDYIAEHKHLPEIPSTKEVIAEGVDLAKMDAKLLQKIEELTLYMIQIQKDNMQLQKDNAALKSRVGELEKNNSTKN